MFDEPEDGWHPLEKMLIKQIIMSIYSNLESDIDRFIFVMVFEAGYTQEHVAVILKISQPAVNKRLNKALVKVRNEKSKYLQL